MAKYDVNTMVLCTICQKCPAKPTKVPLTDFLLPNGLLWIPEMLYCPDCGNYVTIQVRERTKVEQEAKAAKEKEVEQIQEVDTDVAETQDETEN